MKIGLISTYFKLAGCSELDKALLKLCNIKYTIRSRFSLIILTGISPVGVYLLKVNNENVRTRREICSKLTIKTPERHRWRRFGVSIVNFEHISHLVIVNFEDIIAGRV